jgi:hypothetical protein
MYIYILYYNNISLSRSLALSRALSLSISLSLSLSLISDPGNRKQSTNTQSIIEGLRVKHF